MEVRIEDEKKYGIPELKKYPMPDADHVRSAIRFFNYVTPKYEEELAKAILKRMKEYGMSFKDFTVGEENRFSKYIPETGELQHHGIKGQRWGVRRFQNTDGTLTEAGKKRYDSKPLNRDLYSRSGETSSGKKFSVVEPTPGKFARFLQSHSKRFKDMAETSISTNIFDENGKKIGVFDLDDKGDGEINGNWLNIKNSQRGNGYATAVLKDSISWAKENGYKKFTLEVPGISPDARHIYEKLGFKVVEQITNPDDDFAWEGLTAMELDLDNIEHHGIKGQRWGVRRYQNEDGTLTPAGKRHYQRADDRWVRRNATKIHDKAFKQSQREMRKETKKLDRKYMIKSDNERNGRRYMNEYNQKLAEIMNTKVTNISSPSGKVIKFVAKRGEYGVHTALADPDYDMNKVKSGIWDDGRVAYKTQTIDRR